MASDPHRPARSSRRAPPPGAEHIAVHDERVLAGREEIRHSHVTNNNAYATWDEKVKGSIEPGKLADFVILSADFMTIPEDQILQLHPMATYVGGRKVFAAPDATATF